MRYTHDWNRPQSISPTAFDAIAKDLLALLPALEVAGAPLANAYGREQPEIGPDFIGFNGVTCCGHAKPSCAPSMAEKTMRTELAAIKGSQETYPIGPVRANAPTSRSGLNDATPKTTELAE